MATLKAVVFDMDDTLLSINLSAFIGVFALDEANLLAQVARKPIVSLFSPLGSAMLALNNGDRAQGDTRTNRQFFADEIERRCGIPILEPAIADMLDFYEREVLPKKNDRTISARPREEPTRRCRPCSTMACASRYSPTRASRAPASNAVWAGATCSTCPSNL